MGAVEGGTDFLESFIDLIGEFPGGVAGFFLKVVKSFTDLLAGLGSFIGGEGDSDGDAGEKA